MRVFKFRAWEDGEMYYNVRCGGMFDGIPTAPTVWINECGWVNLTGQPHTKIMQWTGFKDKNGVEIYEGDILKDSDGVGAVKWIQEHCAFLRYISDPSGYYLIESGNGEDISELEVIGNIFENKKLLETE